MALTESLTDKKLAYHVFLATLSKLTTVNVSTRNSVVDSTHSSKSSTSNMMDARLVEFNALLTLQGLEVYLELLTEVQAVLPDFSQPEILSHVLKK